MYLLEINHSSELIETLQETREYENETQESKKQDRSTDQPIRQPRPKRTAAKSERILIISLLLHHTLIMR